MPEHSDLSVPHARGKAKQLLELTRAGFRVPEFHISPPDIARAIEILGVPLAVRSSACAEDGHAASFAGQFRSFLNLQTVREVEEAVQRCREALIAPSVADYCRRSNVDPLSLRMDVIIQRMVQPELAGVAFTINPATGAEEVTIEACEGLADELLAGRAQSLPATHPLLLRHAPEIKRTARAIQRHFGEPQDIEFAIEHDLLYVLQSRPVTRIHFLPSVGEWTNADFRDGGVSSTVCTPLMWSLYEFIWDGALKGFMRDIHLFDRDFQAGRMFFGRPYWNLGEVKRCLAKLPGFVEREFDRDLSVHTDYDGDGIVTPLTLRGVIRALPTLLGISAVWRRQERFDRDFLAGGFEALLRKYELIPETVDAVFRELIRDAYWITESNYFRTIFCTSLAKLDFMDAFPDADFPALTSALPAIRHLEPTLMMREMNARGETDITPLLSRYAHHSRHELDISAPRWDEDPAWVATLLAQHTARAGSDPGPAYEAARAQALAGLPRRKRRSFEAKLERLRRFLWLREEMRDLSSRMYHLIRRYVLDIAERRGLGDDIFFMRFQDIIDDKRSSIGPGRERYESFRNFSAPNEIGSRFRFTSRPERGALRGIGASPGTAQGTARVIRNIEESIGVESGDVLVCPYTDPGWTPVLDRVAGVVTETGGLLSHAAVICREYGIPAVLGVPQATERVTEGAWVAVHGSEGLVDLVESREAASGVCRESVSTAGEREWIQDQEECT